MCASRAFRKSCPLCRRDRDARDAETPIKPYDNVPVFAWLWLRGKMPDLRAADFADVSAGRARNGTSVCWLLSGIWDFAGHGQVAVFYLLDHHSDDDRFARAPASRR